MQHPREVADSVASDLTDQVELMNTFLEQTLFYIGDLLPFYLLYEEVSTGLIQVIGLKGVKALETKQIEDKFACIRCVHTQKD